MSDPDDKVFEQNVARLREDYARQPRHAPGAELDNVVRNAARDLHSRRRWRTWSVAASVAACIGLAVVLVPALLIEQPVSTHATQEGELLLRVSREAAQQIDIQERRAARQAEMAPLPSSEAPVLAYAPPPAAPVEIPYAERSTARPEINIQSQALAANAAIAPREKAALPGATAPTSSQSTATGSMNEAAAKTNADESFVESLAARDEPRGSSGTQSGDVSQGHTGVSAEVDTYRVRLADADENTWRERLLELRAAGREDVALVLMEDFRQRFDRPASFSFADLEREAGDARTVAPEPEQNQ